MSRAYRVNEIFYSIQGEGMRAGTANVFVRFSGCNLQCSEDEDAFEWSPYVAGFDCDTEFLSGRSMSEEELIDKMSEVGGDACRACVLTGGEPALQLNQDLVDALRSRGWYVAVETNGTRQLPTGIDWICVSPKTAWHTIRQTYCDELKMVRHVGQELPVSVPMDARNLLVSPAFDPDWSPRENLAWCIELVKRYPGWRLSVQQHKEWRVR